MASANRKRREMEGVGYWRILFNSCSVHPKNSNVVAFFEWRYHTLRTEIASSRGPAFDLDGDGQCLFVKSKRWVPYSAY